MILPCYSPLEGWRHKDTNGFTTQTASAQRDAPLTVPCGQCIGCRLERSRQWAVRCVHEASMHTDNCFVTLTYDDDNLPYAGTLYRPDFQKFMKRLLKNTKTKIRVYYCGEYGETTQRPHYHACLFGWRPSDPELFSVTKAGHKLYESPILTKNWGLGHATFGEMNFETAAYTARYILKKQTGENSKTHYETMEPETGEITVRIPEFSGMSRRPGIGLSWLKKYGHDTYDKDEVILQGRAMLPPKAYDRAFEHIDYDKMEDVKAKRVQKPRKFISERRLWTAQKIQEIENAKLKRDITP